MKHRSETTTIRALNLGECFKVSGGAKSAPYSFDVKVEGSATRGMDKSSAFLGQFAINGNSP